ncbi:MAG: hypothetical protein Q4F54_05875 [Coriobacteriia bacterium]|nr:hypothetical protein [Coriobacteriia bacterium]
MLNDANNSDQNISDAEQNNGDAGFFFGWFDVLKTIDILKLFA